MKHIVLFWLCFASCAFAEQPWPKRVAQAHFAAVNTATLPRSLRDALLGIDEFTQGTDKLPDSLDVCRTKLNGHAPDEFIVQSNQSYSGGLMMYVFERRKQQYVWIGEASGGIYFGHRANGYLQIISQSRAGGAMITRCLLCYQRGKYHLVRIADYRVLESNDDLEFVRERDPKPFDN